MWRNLQKRLAATLWTSMSTPMPSRSVNYNTVWVITNLMGDLGPCPPCPVTVNVTCYCASKPPSTKRCCNRGWSCGGQCGKPLACNKHSCNNQCHSGNCPPCTKKSVQKCLCGAQQKLRDCATPEWQCDKV